MQSADLQGLLADWRQTEERYSELAEAYSQAPLDQDHELRTELDELSARRADLLNAICDCPISSAEEAAAKLQIAASACDDDHKPAILSVIEFLGSLKKTATALAAALSLITSPSMTPAVSSGGALVTATIVAATPKPPAVIEMAKAKRSQLGLPPLRVI